MSNIKNSISKYAGSVLGRNIAQIITDSSVFIFSYIVPFAFYHPNAPLNNFAPILWVALLCLIIIKNGILWAFNPFHKRWTSGIVELIKTILAIVVFFVFDFVTLSLMQIKFNIMYIVWVSIITFLLLFISRYSGWINNYVKERINPNHKRRIMVIGAGEVGTRIIDYVNFQNIKDKKVVVCIDDDRKKHKTKLLGVEIIGGREKILEAAKKYKVDEIIIAIAAATRSDIKAIIEICNNTSCSVNIIPALYELMNGNLNMFDTRKVNIYDLLGREEIHLDNEKIGTLLKGKSVLVTGGGGSIGSELCRQIINFSPKQLIIFDIYENNAYELQTEINSLIKNCDTKVAVRIGSVRDARRVENIIKEFKVDIIFHAAAHKHVPLMEDSPAEAIKNNVFGTYNVANAAHKYGIEKFVLISTDKAVNPSSIMGATKRVTELIIQAIDRVSKTEYVAVRFGNVLGSNGSVIPLFLKRIGMGLPLTVTHPDMTRYFMTIPEASRLVLQAGAMAKGGEIFILDMGEPVRILDLAENLIKLLGYKPYEQIPIEFTQPRPGEKINEELAMSEEEVEKTIHSKIFIVKPMCEDFNLKGELERLKKLIDSGKSISVDDVLNKKEEESKEIV